MATTAEVVRRVILVLFSVGLGFAMGPDAGHDLEVPMYKKLIEVAVTFVIVLLILF